MTSPKLSLECTVSSALYFTVSFLSVVSSVGLGDQMVLRVFVFDSGLCDRPSHSIGDRSTILLQVRELGCFFCGFVSIFISGDVKVSRYPVQVCSSVEGFKDVSNLLCVWVEAVYTKEQRLAIRTYDGVVIFLVYLHPFEGLHECSFFFIV